ncbi:hypothetical protein [Mariniluteicoccus flavus]
MTAFAVAMCAALATTGCVARAQPAPAVIADTPPPWRPPRDAVSHIDLAGLPHVPLDATENQRILRLAVTVDGASVEVPAHIGVDRIRAVQAPVHTHDTSGTVWLEGQGVDRVTLRDFFTLWGVRFDGRCVGAACGGVRVVVDGAPVADPTGVRLASVRDRVEVTATS